MICFYSSINSLKEDLTKQRNGTIFMRPPIDLAIYVSNQKGTKTLKWDREMKMQVAIVEQLHKAMKEWQNEEK